MIKICASRSQVTKVKFEIDIKNSKKELLNDDKKEKSDENTIKCV